MSNAAPAHFHAGMSAPGATRCRPVVACASMRPLCKAASPITGKSPGFSSQAVATSPCARAAHARMPPHSGQGRPVRCLNAHRGMSPSDKKRGARHMPTGSTRPTARRHGLSARASALTGSGTDATRVGELLGHVVAANEGDGQCDNDAHNAKNETEVSDDAQHQHAQERT